MARLGFYVGLFVVCFFLWLGLLTTVSRADHNTYLPLVPNTPLMQSIKTTQTVKWCVNSTGVSYPNFVSQLEDVHAAYARDVGIKFERVTWGSMATTGCQVQHNLTDFSCNGCAAHIFYANWPVVVEYKVNLGYADWRSAQGHELGHGLLGLHEQYKDSGGVIQCVYRDDTVMSCGSPFVKYPQPRDVNLGCAILLTSWCGAKEPTVYPFWDGTYWVFEYWRFKPSDGTWYDPNGFSEWGPQGALADGSFEQYNWRLGKMYRGGFRWTERLPDGSYVCLSGCW